MPPAAPIGMADRQHEIDAKGAQRRRAQDPEEIGASFDPLAIGPGEPLPLHQALGVAQGDEGVVDDEGEGAPGLDRQDGDRQKRHEAPSGEARSQRGEHAGAGRAPGCRR